MTVNINGQKTIFGVINKHANPNLELAGQAILLSSIGFSIASVEMSSKFSVKNFSTDQRTMQAASSALDMYNTVGILWAIGVTLMLTGSYGKPGLAWGIITNVAVLAWINISYLHAFKQATQQHRGIKYPRCMYGMINPNKYPADFETNPRFEHLWKKQE